MDEPTFSENFFEETALALEDSRFKDVKIVLSDDPMKPEYHLHKVILAASCSFFRKLFYHEPKEVYEIGSVSKGGFDFVLRFIYGCGHLNLTQQNVDEFEDVVRSMNYLGLQSAKVPLPGMGTWMCDSDSD